MSTRLNAKAVDAGAAMVLPLLLTAYLIGGESGASRLCAVPRAFGAAGLCASVVRDARCAACMRWAARADVVAEQMSQVATWCGQLSEHLRIPVRQRELSQENGARLAGVITQGERALATWSSGPAGRRRLGRLESLTGRLVPEMAAGVRRARHEHVIAVRGPRA